MPAQGMHVGGRAPGRTRRPFDLEVPMATQLRVAEERLTAITRGPLPASRKIFVAGQRFPFLRVPMREIRQAPGCPPVLVYDTSRPYTDPEAEIDVQRGIAPVRERWIRAREDVVELPRVSSEYGRARLDDRALDAVRFGNLRRPLRARPGENVTQMHYARRGLVTPELGFVGIRLKQRIEAAYAAQHHGA